MSTEQKILRIQQIMQYLPHRYPFLMIDQVLDYQEKTLTALKNVTVNEPYFTGHFPEHPVMPGVMIIEALAQAGAILAYLQTNSTPQENLFYLAAIDNAKFKQMVLPGDQLLLAVEHRSTKGSFWKLHGQALVGNKVVASVDILSAIRKVEP